MLRETLREISISAALHGSEGRRCMHRQLGPARRVRLVARLERRPRVRHRLRQLPAVEVRLRAAVQRLLRRACVGRKTRESKIGLARRRVRGA